MNEELLRELTDEQLDELTCEVLAGCVAEIRRLRSELASERATHQELWQMVDRELDRIYCDAKGIKQ